MRRTARQAQGGIWLSVASFFLCSNAGATPADTYGLGARATALGGAVAASSEDFSATFYNPAGLSDIPQTRLSMGLQYASPRLQEDHKTARIKASLAGLLGLVVPGHLGLLPVAIGLGAQLSGKRLNRVVTLSGDEQRWLLYEHQPEQVHLTSAIAIRPWPWLGAGVGLGLLASSQGQLLVTGRAVQPSAIASEYDSELSHEVVASLGAARYPILGVTLAPTPDWRVAFVYRGEAQVELGVDAKIEGQLALGNPDDPLLVPIRYALESTTISSFVPRQIILGAHYEPAPIWNINLDLTWLNWSSYVSPLSATESRLDIESPEGLALVEPALPASRALHSARLQDRLRVSAGLECTPRLTRLLTLPVRLGYAYEPSPVENTSSPHVLDSPRQITSAGLGLSRNANPSNILSGVVQLDLFVQWIHLADTRHPTPGGARQTEIGGQVWAGGASLTLDL